MKVYVPDLEEYSCVTVKDSETIRAYKESPVEGSKTSYRDYFIHSDYYYVDGVEDISNSVPVCLDTSMVTNEFYYRVDFPDILIILFIFSIFVFLIPIKVFIRLFRRFQ